MEINNQCFLKNNQFWMHTLFDNDYFRLHGRATVCIATCNVFNLYLIRSCSKDQLQGSLHFVSEFLQHLTGRSFDSDWIVNTCSFMMVVCEKKNYSSFGHKILTKLKKISQRTIIKLFTNQLELKDLPAGCTIYSIKISQILQTYDTTTQTPDSGATATAMMCGVKTSSGVIGLNQHAVRANCSSASGNDVKSALIHAQEGGNTNIIVSGNTTNLMTGLHIK